MTVTLTPEVEALVQQKIAEGKYATAEDVVTNAVYQLHEDPLSAMSISEMQALIDEGVEAADRGELVTPEEARAHLARVRAELAGA